MSGWQRKALFIAGLVVLAAGAYQGGARDPRRPIAARVIAIDYPEQGSIFPPEITSPTFLWRDPAPGAALWHIDVAFGDGAPALHSTSEGPRPRIGPLDPDCVASTNEPPRLTPEMAAAHSWTPDAVTWQAIKRHSVAGPATVTIRGFRKAAPDAPVSAGQVSLRTSRDPAGAPIFYRDVPLMPSELERGVIKPLAAEAIPLVAWRVRNLGEPRSRVVMENLPLCANCHSFSADGKTMGMDLDGLQGNRGMYFLARVEREMNIRQQDVIQWSTPAGKLKGNVRVGFMSQVSPDGRYVATTLNPAALAPGAAQPPSNYYVANFKDYRFLQVFYPARGILGWYSRETGVLTPLPGADTTSLVQMGAVWTPDGDSLVFARAPAADPNPPGVPLAQFANDPAELQIRYDLYRIPFRNGRGGVAEPLAGASANGMSNSFPKVSPDGKWIVYVQSRNGELMRPDSQLYIVPAAGGTARRMRCNTSRMNSWHSFSPNGRWLVFSSKSRGPYTQMYLTHIDAQGNDSPAILVDNTTAANRAVNIPEFVNVPLGGLRQIGGPVLDYYRQYNRAAFLQKRGRYREAAEKWQSVLELGPEDEAAHRALGTALLIIGRREEAGVHFQKANELKLRAAVESEPASGRALNDLGVLLLHSGRAEEAASKLRQAVALEPAFAAAHANLGGALVDLGGLDEAQAHLDRALALDSVSAPAHYYLGLLLSRRGDADGAIREWRSAVAGDPKRAEAHTHLGDALYARGRPAEALAEWHLAVDLQPADPAALVRVAWALATSSDGSIRNGGEALAYAVRAVELPGGKIARVLDAMAAAYAEKGQFANAVLTARRALAQAGQEKQDALAAAIAGRIRLYESEQAYREP